MYRPQAVSILSRRHFVAVSLALVTLWYLTFHSAGRNSLGSRIGVFAKGGEHLGDGWLSQDQFVDKALENDMYVHQYNGTAVRKLCSEARWREDIVVSCDKLAGGIGNVKVNLLSCLRYTIESGGMWNFLDGGGRGGGEYKY